MHHLSHAVFICAVFLSTVFTGLLGLVQVFRPWDPKSPVWLFQSWFSVTQRNFLLLLLYFAAFLIAIIVLFGIWQGFKSYIAFQLLLELSWLNRLGIEAVLIFRLSRTTGIFHILVPVIIAIAGLLQAVGFAVLFYDNDTGIYVTFSGSCVFHIFAAALVIYILFKYKAVRHRKLVFIALTYVCAVGGYGFILISNKDMFFLANCILEFCVNVILFLLLLTPIKKHKERNERSNWISRYLDIEKISAERGPSVQYNLPPAPPPTPQKEFQSASVQ
ncbi:hypothetical protein GQ43DRAFT_485323 [Delitschia confertaspora ATCC 74209]|uniref:Uncharacterized protein n=1 Tax=Delitschia confertaspora ATCC 74209 TaxID=1513339 RepID=A0A9P4JAG5_9PLEO|nr:hypothetical protein GQ43DRAFT_485323 [Delitschia confertaspora ATCC 74209]